MREHRESSLHGISDERMDILDETIFDHPISEMTREDLVEQKRVLDNALDAIDLAVTKALIACAVTLSEGGAISFFEQVGAALADARQGKTDPLKNIVDGFRNTEGVDGAMMQRAGKMVDMMRRCANDLRIVNGRLATL